MKKENVVKCSFTDIPVSNKNNIIQGPNNINISDKAVFMCVKLLLEKNHNMYYKDMYNLVQFLDLQAKEVKDV